MREADLLALPSDFRLVRVGRNKAPIDGPGWNTAPGLTPDEAAALNGNGPPAWGLMTGEVSGIAVLDLDAEGWRESFQQVTGHPITDLPPTIAWTSGKPGRSGHAFQVPMEWWPSLAGRQWTNDAGEVSWEFRWNGQQAVIMGAHPETGSYRWLPGRSPHDISDPAEAPDWLLEAVTVQEHPDAPAVAPTAEDAARAVAMLGHIDPQAHSSYRDWLRVGMALHHTDPGLLSEWVEWSRPMATFDEAECLAKWQSFGKRTKGRPATIATLHHLAKAGGYKEPRPRRRRGKQRAVAGGGSGQGANPVAPPPEGGIELQSKRSDWLPLVMEHVFSADGARWVTLENRLHRWTGTHYEPLHDTDLAPRVARFLQRLWYRDRETGECLHPWATPARTDEAIAWLKRRTAASLAGFDPGNALNLKNGVLSWTWDGDRLVTRLDPHGPKMRFTYCRDYGYDPAADRSALNQLLAAIDDREQDTFQRIMGSSLEMSRYRAAQGRPRALLMVGDGENGKDTIRGAHSATVGERGFTSCSIGDFQQYDQGRKFPIAPLMGARVNWASENTGFARLESIQCLKVAISGESLRYEPKNVQEMDFTPNALLIFNCNDPPRLDASSAAMSSRWHVIAFRKRFTANPDPANPLELKADPRMKDDPDYVREHVCPAYLNWLLEGLQLAVRDGITYDPDSEALEAIRRQSSHLFDFCDDVGLVEDPGGSVEVSVIHGLLESWYVQEKILHIAKDGRRTWYVADLGGDRPVKLTREVVGRLRAVFPKCRRELDQRSRRAVVKGVALEPLSVAARTNCEG